MEEYENILSPTYEEIVLFRIRQGIRLTTLDAGYKKLTKDMSKQGEEWHKAIDMVITELETKIIEIKVKHREILKEQLNEIKQIQSLIGGDIKCFHITTNILLEKNRTKFGKFPNDIAVDSKRNLIYTDGETRTVNRRKIRQTEELIRLNSWTQNALCVTSTVIFL